MSRTFFYSLGRTTILFYTWLMLRTNIHWQAPLPTGPKLIVANHPSASDPLCLMLLFRQPISILIVDSPFSIPVLGSVLRRSGHVPVVPGDGRPAFETARRLLEDGHSVAVFPEGWISPREGGFHTPRSGAARLALLTGAPIIPVGIYLPRERNVVLSSTINGRQTVGAWYLRGPYGMTVGQAQWFDGDVSDRDHVTAVSESIMQQITGLAQESQQRVA